jgi:DNA-binding transcriptional regulator LsrR (DeoR family)
MRNRGGEAAVHGSGADRAMMRLVAELYYERDLRQPEIADLTGFSVSKVSRLLAQARDQGVVRITIEPGVAPPSEAGWELGQRFGAEIVVTPGREADPGRAARLCGLASAEMIAARLPHAGTIGVAGGYTIDALVSGLPRMELAEATIVPVVGGWDTRNPYLDSNELARRMAARLGAQVRFLHAPGMLDTPEMKDALLRDSSIASTIRRWASLEMALLGVSGGPLAHPGYGTVMDRIDDDGRQRLASLGVVGDLAGHLFRLDGSFVEDQWSRRTISISLDEVRRIPLVALVAAGSNKVAAILGALRTGAVHLVLTDGPTAEAALRLADATA